MFRRLLILTKAALSVTNTIYWLAMWQPQIRTARAIGKSSRKVILKDCHWSGKEPKKHWRPKIAPSPFSRQLSCIAHELTSSRGDGVFQISDKKKERPLNSLRNVSHTSISCLVSLLSLMPWCGRYTPTVRSIERRRKARPGTMTEPREI